MIFRAVTRHVGPRGGMPAFAVNSISIPNVCPSEIGMVPYFGMT
jgi:hypothetical protein